MDGAIRSGRIFIAETTGNDGCNGDECFGHFDFRSRKDLGRVNLDVTQGLPEGLMDAVI